MRKCFVPIAAGALILSTILGVSAVSAADWRLALPTSTGLAFVDPSSSGSSAVTFSGQEFGQVDEVIATDENTRLMASISAVGGGTETILAFDTRSLQALGTTSFGSSMYGIIPNNTVVMPDGKSVVIVSFDGNLNYLDINTGKAITKAIALEGNPFGAVLSTDGSTIFVGLKEEGEKDVTLSLSLVGTNPLAPSKKIVFGKVKYTEEEVEYRLQVNGNKAAAFTPGAAFIADLSTGKAKKVALTYNKKSLTPFGMSADGKTLICRYGDGATGIFVADASTGRVTKRILMKDPAYSMNSADGSLIYVSSPTKATLGVFDSSNMDIVSSYSIEGLTGPVRILKDPTSSALPVPKAIGGNIVIVGDNILGGAGDAKETFATLLAKKLSSEGYGIPVINSCSAEATAAELAEGFEGSVNEYNPKLVV
jgi:WD40 repeat protein